MDLKKIDNVTVEGIDYMDAPDFCDAFISGADYDGKPMTEPQLEEINNNSDFVYEAVLKKIY